MGICWDISVFIKILKSDGETEGEAYLCLGCPPPSGHSQSCKGPQSAVHLPHGYRGSGMGGNLSWPSARSVAPTGLLPGMAPVVLWRREKPDMDAMGRWVWPRCGRSVARCISPLPEPPQITMQIPGPHPGPPEPNSEEGHGKGARRKNGE